MDFLFPSTRTTVRSGQWHLARGDVLSPLVDYEAGDAVMNIAVFVPLGILLGLVLSPGSWWRVTAVAAACSLAIEVTQYVTAHLLGGGHVADVNDLLCNVLGGALGAGLLALLGRVPGFGGLVERFRWRAAVR